MDNYGNIIAKLEKLLGKSNFSAAVSLIGTVVVTVACSVRAYKKLEKNKNASTKEKIIMVAPEAGAVLASTLVTAVAIRRTARIGRNGLAVAVGAYKALASECSLRCCADEATATREHHHAAAVKKIVGEDGYKAVNLAAYNSLSEDIKNNMEQLADRDDIYTWICSVTGQTFTATQSDVLQAIIDINKKLTYTGRASLNDFYKSIDCNYIPVSARDRFIGWTEYLDGDMLSGYSWVDVLFQWDGSRNAFYFHYPLHPRDDIFD